MRKLTIAIVMAGLVAASGACADNELPCPEDAAFEAAAVQDGSQDWRAEIDSIVSIAPADSVMNIIVFVAADARAAFSTWAEEHDIPVAYAFQLFSAYRITPRVSDLVVLKESWGVTGIDWGGVSLPPLCG